LERFFANLSTRPRRQPQMEPTADGSMATSAIGQPVPPTYQTKRQAQTQLQILEAISDVFSPIILNNIEIRIGRASAQNEIAFPNDMSVSRIHASMIREGNSYRIFDEQSTSGTFVNGQPVQEYGTLLIDGDELTLGSVRMRFKQVS
ncbi:MAG: FHA domain-containing protein, partial [Anaerolineales bacterium]|nr:FHA domain-containing protein [Anaerolineales bacterium]